MALNSWTQAPRKIEQIQKSERKQAKKLKNKMKDISTLLNAPPSEWKKEEREQMRRLHLAFRQTVHQNNYERFKKQAEKLAVANGERMPNPAEGGEAEGKGGEGDGFTHQGAFESEGFLKGDAIVLGSVNGELRKPLNAPWNDFTAFETQLDFCYWSGHFDKPATDLVLNRMASSLVNHVCVAQADRTVRVRHGSIPLGRYLRKKREHITPLALCLHELKLWSTHVLRTMDAYQKGSSEEINDRIMYIERLQEKEVWGPAKVSPRSGMRASHHHALFRLLLECKADLVHARDYAYRKYSMRAAREKLEQLSNTLKNVLFNEVSLLSRAFELHDSLSDAKTRALQPTNLFNSARDQSFVNWRNMATVLMADFCQSPLVRACMLSDLDRVQLEDITAWGASNPFRNTAEAGTGAYDQDGFCKLEHGCVPALYAVAAAAVSARLREHDRSATKPDSARDVASALAKAFRSKDTAAEVSKALLDVMAALHDFVPMLYIVFQLHSLAGAGGDFTVFDLLRQQVIAAMTKAYACVQRVQQAQRSLLALLDRLAREERNLIEQERLKSKKARYMPPWIGNLAHIHHNNVNATNRSLQDGLEQLLDFKQDAESYSLTADQLNNRIADFRKVCDALCPTPPGSEAPLPDRFIAVREG